MDKNTILAAKSEQDIFLKFLQLSEFPKGNISSPFSDDKNASFKLYKNNTYKCNSTGRQGDCFQFVADLKDIDCKQNFNEVLKIIAKEFNITENTESNHFSFATKFFTKEPLDYFSQSNCFLLQNI